MSDDNDIRHGRHCVFKMHVQTLLERRPVVSVPLRVVLRRRSDLRRAPVHRTAAIAALKPKGGYAARAILPRPERRGLSRTGSDHGPRSPPENYTVASVVLRSVWSRNTDWCGSFSAGSVAQRVSIDAAQERQFLAFSWGVSSMRSGREKSVAHGVMNEIRPPCTGSRQTPWHCKRERAPIGPLKRNRGGGRDAGCGPCFTRRLHSAGAAIRRGGEQHKAAGGARPRASTSDLRPHV